MGKKKEYKIVFVPSKKEPLTDEEMKEYDRKLEMFLREAIKLMPNDDELVNI